MSDRYLLARDDNSPLELNVMTTIKVADSQYQESLRRRRLYYQSCSSLRSIEDGQSNIRVDSLFLDEGFGTLDEESLDIALDTLTSLQQEGKLIASSLMYKR